MSAMVQFGLYWFGGFVPLWLLLFYWGFSRGPASAMPYFTLLAYLSLVLVAAPVSLYFEKIGALAGLLGSGTGLIWPLSGFLAGDAPVVEASVVGGLLVAVAMHSVARLVRHRRASWLELTDGLTMPLRLVLTVLPLGGLGLLVNLPLVFQLLLQGPPGW